MSSEVCPTLRWYISFLIAELVVTSTYWIVVGTTVVGKADDSGVESVIDSSEISVGKADVSEAWHFPVILNYIDFVIIYFFISAKFQSTSITWSFDLLSLIFKASMFGSDLDSI